MSFHLDMTLREAKAELRLLVEDGAECPCCTQFAKIYRRKIHAGMAYSLIVMYRTGGLDWQQKTRTLRGVGSSARDESILRYWNLTEEESDHRKDGGRTGWWRITERGEAWVLNRSTVPKYAHIYDSRCLGLHGDPVTVIDALGTKFNYRELMEGE